MKAFNGRAAAEEYMSTHSLTFSTPEMTLKKFLIWLGEPVPSPNTKENIPRLLLYLEDRDSQSKATRLADLMPETDDTFKPSGAVTDMYAMRDYSPPIAKDNKAKSDSLSGGITNEERKICSQCGSIVKANSRFCRNCGAKQK
jgi:zinc-ribbon domain